MMTSCCKSWQLERLCAPVEQKGAGLSKTDLNALLDHGINCAGGLGDIQRHVREFYELL